MDHIGLKLDQKKPKIDFKRLKVVLCSKLPVYWRICSLSRNWGYGLGLRKKIRTVVSKRFPNPRFSFQGLVGIESSLWWDVYQIFGTTWMWCQNLSSKDICMTKKWTLQLLQYFLKHKYTFVPNEPPFVYSCHLFNHQMTLVYWILCILNNPIKLDF